MSTRGSRSGILTCTVEGCDAEFYCKSMCQIHYARTRKTGTPILTEKTLDERFRDKVSVKSLEECWEWQGSRNARGYGQISMGGRNGRPELAHRVSLALTGVNVPRGLGVLHHCDNPPCVNPRHLYVGDQKQNAKDAIERGQFLVGSRAPSARLTEDQVREIKSLIASGFTDRQIAEDLPVSRSSINKIRKGAMWKHVS